MICSSLNNKHLICSFNFKSGTNVPKKKKLFNFKMYGEYAINNFKSVALICYILSLLIYIYKNVVFN